MAFDKIEIKQIETIVGGTETRINKRLDGFEIKIDGVETRINKRIDGVEVGINKRIDGVEVGINKRIDGVETRLEKKIESTKEEIVTTLSREIADLSEINRGVINRVDKIVELEQRIVRLETLVLNKR